MCDVVTKVMSAAASVPAASAAGAAQAATTVAEPATVGLGPAVAAGRHGGDAPLPHRTRLVLLGTAGGPVALGGDRFGVSTAVVYEDRVYVVDLGLGALQRLVQSGLAPKDRPGGTALANVRGIFFTHLHSDHFTDWPATYAIGSMNMQGRVPGTPIQVRGPGNRGTLPRVFPPSRPEPPVHNPENPTPGIREMTDYLTQAFAQDFNDRARDNNFPSPPSTFAVEDIDLAGRWSPTPEGVPPRLDAPIPVWEDGEVRVTATLVDHHPIAPAFAYRFDTPDGSVVVSGDTTVSQNLIDLARGADYLVHEVIDPDWVQRLVASLPPEIGGPAGEHLISAHTTIEQVGRDVAEPAGVANLVLNHLVPTSTPTERWEEAEKGFSGRLIVGEDLRQFGVGTASRGARA